MEMFRVPPSRFRFSLTLPMSTEQLDKRVAEMGLKLHSSMDIPRSTKPELTDMSKRLQIVHLGPSREQT